MTQSTETYLLDIEWSKPGLPSLVGPFDTIEEAASWGERNIPNGSWEIRPLAAPYARVNGRIAEVSR